MADYVESFFDRHGVMTRRQHVLPGRDNVIAVVPGQRQDRRVVLEAHMDTVSADAMSIAPFDPVCRGGRMYGRGACDTKSGLAAMMHAVVHVHHSGQRPPCEIWFAATVDEEFRYRGVATLCESLTASAAMVAEPTELQPVIASKGLVRFKIVMRGRAAHSAKPHLGINAIEHMSRVIASISNDINTSCETHPLLGPPTCNIGVIRGGTQINIVPAECEIEIDRRLLPGETPEHVMQHYRTLVAPFNHPDEGITCEVLRPMLTDVPLDTDASHPAVVCLGDVLSELGLDPQPIGVPFCSDASKFGAKGIPSLIFGPGNIDQAHAADEYVDCDQVVLAERAYQRFLQRFDGDA